MENGSELTPKYRKTETEISDIIRNDMKEKEVRQENVEIGNSMQRPQKWKRPNKKKYTKTKRSFENERNEVIRHVVVSTILNDQ